MACPGRNLQESGEAARQVKPAGEGETSTSLYKTMAVPSLNRLSPSTNTARRFGTPSVRKSATIEPDRVGCHQGPEEQGSGKGKEIPRARMTMMSVVRIHAGTASRRMPGSGCGADHGC